MLHAILGNARRCRTGFFTKLLPVIAPLAVLGATTAPVRAQATFAGVPPLHTSGGNIVDSTGKVIRLTGLNWFGLDTADESLHGLWAHGMNWYLDNIVVKYGFNCLRVPYSSAILDSSTAHINYQVIDVLPNDIAANPSLAENTNGAGDDGIAIESSTPSQSNILITPLQELDLLVQKCQARGIYVILDQHTGDNAGQQDADPYSNPGQANWENDWVTLVNRYKSYSCVIGCDLHNEPHGISWATWQAEAQDCANKILAADPTKLVIVEGTDNDSTFTYVWWGGDLYDAGSNLVKPTVASHVVYSAHEYTTDVSGGQSYDNPSTPGYPTELDSHFTRDWGYLAINGIAPVLVGEFGTKMDDTTRTQWMNEMCNYIKTNGLSYTYWAMNPNSGDVGGLLGDNNGTTDGTDWNDIWPNKLSALQSCEFTGSGGGGGTAPSAPTNLTALAGTGKVNLAWTGSSNAASYSVFRGTTSGGESTTAIATGLAGTSYTDTAVVNGTTYYYTVKAVNSAGSSAASNEASAKPTAPAEGPYGGTPAAIAGTVQAENYDTGGQGVAYNVSTVNGTGNSYRTDGVDLETTTDTGGGYNLGWTAAGQWFKYTVNVASAGTYNVTYRVAAPSAVSGAFHIADASGNNLSGAISVPATGGWQTWTNVTGTVTLPAGVQTLTLTEDAGGWNVNWISFATQSSGGTAPSTPTGLTATAGNAQVSLAWSAASGATSYNVYRSTSAGGEGTTAYKTGLTSASFTDTGLTNGTTYYYKVAAVNSSSMSAQSAEASATPTGGTSGGGSATITAGPNSSNSQWYGEDDLTLANSSPITAFTVSITVQKTSGLTYNGMYNTFGTITETHVDNGTSITYTYSASGVSTTSVTFGAQYNLSGTVHSVTGDTYSVTYTTGGVQYSKSGVI
jgi:fibronectin type 3 domain-containing protein